MASINPERKLAMSNRDNPEYSSNSDTGIRSRIRSFLGKLTIAAEDSRAMVTEVQHETIREHYWQLRKEGRIPEAEQFLVSSSTSSRDDLLYGVPLLLDSDHSGSPRMDARNFDLSGLSDIALSVSVADRTFGFFSIEDISESDRKRVFDISSISESERRKAKLAILALPVRRLDTPRQARLRRIFAEKGTQRFVQVRSPEDSFPQLDT